MAEIFPEDWDNLYVFEKTATQEQIDNAIGSHIPKPDLQRTIVFMKDKRLLRVLHEEDGVETPLHDEVVFVNDGKPWIEIDRSTPFVQARGDGKNGSYYVLQALKPGEVVE